MKKTILGPYIFLYFSKQKLNFTFFSFFFSQTFHMLLPCIRVTVLTSLELQCLPYEGHILPRLVLRETAPLRMCLYNSPGYTGSVTYLIHWIHKIQDNPNIYFG